MFYVVYGIINSMNARYFDTTKFSDEYCMYGEFTGTMIGITCADRIRHRMYADFDFFEYLADETRTVDGSILERRGH